MKTAEFTPIKSWYTSVFTTDTYAEEALNPNASFEGLFRTLSGYQDIYAYLFKEGEIDSVIRERIFTKLAEIAGLDYETIYTRWLSCVN